MGNMPGATKEDQTEIPELLYHTYLRVNSGEPGSPKAIPDVYVLATYGTLNAAKQFALGAISTLGYARDDFDTYEERPKNAEQWQHGDGVLVYAKAPAGAFGFKFFIAAILLDNRNRTQKWDESPC